MREVYVEERVRAPPEKVRMLIMDFERWLRFNPAWYELEILTREPRVEKGAGIKVKVSFEGEEKKLKKIKFSVEDASQDKVIYSLSNGKRIELSIRNEGDVTLLSHRETLHASESEEEKKEEVKHWLAALKHYAELKNTPFAKLSRFFIDRVLLRMNPMQRRITVLIVLLQVGLLATTFFALLVIYVKHRFNL
jgi:hypothetical protein